MIQCFKNDLRHKYRIVSYLITDGSLILNTLYYYFDEIIYSNNYICIIAIPILQNTLLLM